MTRCVRLLTVVVPVFFASTPLSAQASKPIPPNKAYSAITTPLRRTLSGDRAFATVNYVQGFYRNPASRGFDASLDSVVGLLAAAGYVEEKAVGRIPEQGGPRLTYRIESRPSRGLVWSPLGASITLAGRRAPLEATATDHDLLPSNSWSTPAGGVDAEIVSVGGGSDAELERAGVRGKIAYFGEAGGGRGGRGAGAAGPVTRAAAHGAVGVLLSQTLPAYNQQGKNRRAIGFSGIPYDSTARIFALYVSLAARDTLDAALAKGPVRAHVVTETVFENRPERTVVAEVRGSVAPDERFVYSAHVQEPGANDNASGVGLLAEMARSAAEMLSAGQIDPGRTITMLWGVEIQQTQRYIAEDSIRRKGIRWGMSLDMVGENTARTGGTFLIEKMPDPSKIWVRGEDQHTEWGAGARMTQKDIWPHYYNDFVKQRCLDESAATGASWVVKANPYEGGSDHTPFISARIPGVLMWHFTDQHYHDDLDRIDMVSSSELQHVGNCALATSLILTAGHRPEYARAALDELAGIAERRLDAEGQISRAALPSSSIDSQRVILEAWRDYYLGALDKIPEMTLPHVALAPEVAAAQQRVRTRAARILATLNGTARPSPAPNPGMPMSVKAIGPRWYGSWGYNTEGYAPVNISFSQPGLGNDFTLHGRVRDSHTWDLLNHPLTVSQFSVRVGYFIRKNRAIEFNFDHAKAMLPREAAVHATGTINGAPVNRDGLAGEYVQQYKLNNGANFVLLNLVQRVPLLKEPGTTGSLALLAKAGVGFMPAHTTNIVLGQANHPGFQFGGIGAGIEAALRLHLFRGVYVEGAQKGFYGRYRNLRINEGSSDIDLWAHVSIVSLGVAF